MPGRPGLAGLLKGVSEVLIRQLHDDEQLALDDFQPIDSQQKGMANGLDQLKGLPFLLDQESFAIQRLKVAVDELDRLEGAAGSLALPDLAEATAAQELHEPIPGYRLGIGLPE